MFNAITQVNSTHRRRGTTEQGKKEANNKEQDGTRRRYRHLENRLSRVEAQGTLGKQLSRVAALDTWEINSHELRTQVKWPVTDNHAGHFICFQTPYSGRGSGCLVPRGWDENSETARV